MKLASLKIQIAYTISFLKNTVFSENNIIGEPEYLSIVNDKLIRQCFTHGISGKYA
jgi:hypothetical protein